MTAKELFGVGVRLSGLISVLASLPALLQLSLGAAGAVVAGLILITRADLIVDLSYPKELREKVVREF